MDARQGWTGAGVGGEEVGRDSVGGGGAATGTPGMPEALQVAGLCRTGMALAGLAAGLGVRVLALWDPRPVEPADLGTGYLPSDLGRPRTHAAERRLRDLHPGLRVFADHGRLPRPLGEATLAVGDLADADLAARSLAADHVLLPVHADAAGVRVGPWTAPGTPGCALCAEGDGADAPGAGGPRPPSGGRGPATGGAAWGPADVLTAQRAAVLAVDLLRAGPGAGRTAEQAGGVVVAADAATGALRHDAVAPVPGCACAAQAADTPWSSSSTRGP